MANQLPYLTKNVLFNRSGNTIETLQKDLEHFSSDLIDKINYLVKNVISQQQEAIATQNDNLARVTSGNPVVLNQQILEGYEYIPISKEIKYTTITPGTDYNFVDIQAGDLHVETVFLIIEAFTGATNFEIKNSLTYVCRPDEIDATEEKANPFYQYRLFETNDKLLYKFTGTLTAGRGILFTTLWRKKSTVSFVT